MRELILVHGRSQQGKDPAKLKKTWLAALREGMEKAHLPGEIDEDHVHFPFYGNTLIDLIDHSETIESVVVKGGNDSLGTAEAAILAQAVEEVLEANGISKAEVFAAQTEKGIPATKKGPLNWGWVLTALRLLDERGVGTLALELCTRDVYQYISSSAVAQVIDNGVSAAFNDQECVVVAHSLGTVVAYSVLREIGAQKKWKVPAFITLGSPLAIHAVNQLLNSLAMPSCINTWYNGRDPHDTVALFPLAPPHFPDLGIIAKNNIGNQSPNHHGIEEYLRDADVARWIHKELLL